VIAFYGYPDDAPLARAVDAARAAEIEHVVIDQHRLDRHDLVTEVAGDSGGFLRTWGTRLPLSRITAVYARPLEPGAASADPAARARAVAFHRAFTDWLDSTASRVVNRPRAMESNASKPYQAQLIARAGFLVPDTLVTNVPDEVREFRARHGRIIYKSLSAVRSIVREFGDEDERRLERIRVLPTQFQAYVPGRDVRVHTVGARVFATAVDCGATDYRYAARDGVPVEMRTYRPPDDVAERCVRLSAALGLLLAGIDLRLRPDGRWVCFEVNPMPAFSYFESLTGLPISEAIVRLLRGT